METKKRVYCLYRVSTLSQVEKDDIPMQKQACREFSERQGWEVVKEFSEKGVSGFKVSSQKRDAIMEIQSEAALGKFDILLVFMFDRLGRRDDETPFVVEWFIRNNVAVWSVNEGEQRLDSHVDKLLNYIRYWQASGESIKTSIRVKTRLAQLVQDGLHSGGLAPFGYRLEKRGRINKKGHEVNDFVVDDAAADTVRIIFNKYINEGYGAFRLVDYLLEKGVKKTNGKPLSMCNLNKMIQSELYIGYLIRGDIRVFIPELRIIDDETFYRAQEIRSMRRKERNADRRIPMNTRGRSLLSGNIFCGHCGRRMTLNINQPKKYLRKDGGTSFYKEYVNYRCTYGISTPECCCKQNYSAKRVDEAVRSILQRVFELIRETPPADSWERQHESRLSDIRIKIKTANRNISKLNKELSAYKNEVIKVIQGTSAFTAEILNQLIHDTEDSISKLTSELERLKTELDESDRLYEKTKSEHIQIRSWSEIFNESSLEMQKMVAASLISAVKVSREYQIEIDFNISVKEFVENISFNDENISVSV